MGVFPLTRWGQQTAQNAGRPAGSERGQTGRADPAAWRTFFLAMAELAGALVLALFSSVAAQNGNVTAAWLTAVAALGVAAWVMFTLVPALARRTPLRWLAYRIDYKFTKEGMVYVGGIFIVALAALNTGNNLLFMVLACLLAGILISGIVSQLVLSGIDLRMVLPEHIFAGRPILALVEMSNRKLRLASFSLQLVGIVGKSREGTQHRNILTTPVYFPYVPHDQSVQQNVELRFATRGIYRQDLLGVRTRFPFGFLEKTRRVVTNLEAVVYPPVELAGEAADVLPLVNGELESFLRGRGQDLYAIRDFQTSDSARHVDWKASAKLGVLQVREFTRDDDRRVLLALDPFVPPNSSTTPGALDPQFERGITLCASLAWHFHELDSVMGFRSGGFNAPMGPAAESIYAILRYLAGVAPEAATPGRSFLDELAAEPDIFKIILTRRSRAAIPASLWPSSYIVFLNE